MPDIVGKRRRDHPGKVVGQAARLNGQVLVERRVDRALPCFDVVGGFDLVSPMRIICASILGRLGGPHPRAPGRRTSYPHAESAEEEFVYVLEGHPDVWIDGTLHHLDPELYRSRKDPWTDIPPKVLGGHHGKARAGTS